MYSKNSTMTSTSGYSRQIQQLQQAIDSADAILVGAGAGLSTSAGLDYTGERFEINFADFIAKYHVLDMYSATFFPYTSKEEYWAYMSRHIEINRYAPEAGKPYCALLELLKSRNYFILTTNVDHQFQKAGFDKQKLFYTQGDYGLWQCSVPCHPQTYDNFDDVQNMLKAQKDLCIPTALIPRCPKCGKPMSMNLRSDHTFVQDEGWYAAANRYDDFLGEHKKGRILYLELGVGNNTPGIIKYPFWKMTMNHPDATYACLNLEEAVCPGQIKKQSICIEADISWVFEILVG